MSSMKSWCRNGLFLLIVGGFTGLSSGCGGPKLAPVSGRVTVEGKALTSGWVTFHPDTSKGNKFGQLPIGEINSQGEYTLQTMGKPGAPPGAYKVTVTANGATTPDNTSAKPDLLVNSTYALPGTTPLEKEVVAQPAAGAYDLNIGP